MASAVGLRFDFDGPGLRRLARLSGYANQVRRLLALAVIYDGGARHAAAEMGGVGMQTARDRVLRFNAQGPVNVTGTFPRSGDVKFPTLRFSGSAVLVAGFSVFGRTAATFGLRGV